MQCSNVLGRSRVNNLINQSIKCIHRPNSSSPLRKARARDDEDYDVSDSLKETDGGDDDDNNEAEVHGNNEEKEATK